MAVTKYREYLVESTLCQDEVLGFLGTKESWVCWRLRQVYSGYVGPR